MKDKKENIFHSSTYASAQSGGGMGATSTMSFEQRRKIDRNRSLVKRYSDSMVANGSWFRARKVNTDKTTKDKTIKKSDASVKNNKPSKPPARKKPGFYR